MKAAVYNGKELELINVETPIPGKNQVLIKIKATGICGTDIAIINGDLPTPIPIIPGHELSGVIKDVGENVPSNLIGKRVTSEINTDIDYECYYCLKKLYTQCVSRKALGIDVNGSFAEYIVVNKEFIHEIPENLTFEQATFIEPLAAAYQTFETMPLNSDDKEFCIFGLGKLGLLIAQIIVQKGYNLTCIDGSDCKLSLAKKFGAHHLINRFNDNYLRQSLKNVNKGIGFDVVIDTTGNPKALQDIISVCRSRGKIHIKSTHGIKTPMNITELVVREITIYTSRCGPFDLAIENLSSQNISVDDLISKTYDLKDIHKGISAYSKNRDHIKSLVQL